MTANQRIVINFLATYGRSVFALVCGLFSGRWLLMSLGDVDYGLYGVVGGLTSFITFFNSLMGGAVSRYYAFYVGAGSVPSVDGLEICQKWFTTAVVIHTLVPTVLVIIGYPLGIWAVENFLVIPQDRVMACVWVWRFVCINCFVGMVNVPFSAMYTAKQEIAEMTIYRVVEISLNVCVLYYMVSHEGNWLTTYAACACVISVIPRVVIGIRAILVFPECRFRLRYAYDWNRIRDLAIFASFRFAGACTAMIQNQGMAILTNKFLGPSRNASMAIGNTLASQSETLAGALDTAIGPAVTNACGAGDYNKMRSLCFYACKFGTILMLVFAIPLSLEVNEVMRLWLKNPPEYAASLCVCVLVCLVMEKICAGHFMAIFAFGRIGWYQFVVGFGGIVILPIAWFMMRCGWDLLAVGYALIVGKVITTMARLWFGRIIGTLPIMAWVRSIFLPILVSSAVSFLFGSLPSCLMSPSFGRIVLTTVLAELLLLPMCWFVVLSRSEREFLMSRMRERIRR